MDRFPALTSEEMSEAQKKVAAAISSGPRGGVRGPFVALLHSPEAANRVQALGEHLRFGTPLPQRLLELAILIASRRWSCQFEWFVHEPLARKAGLDLAICDSIAAGQRPVSLQDDEKVVYDFCTTLQRTGFVDDDAFNAAVAKFGRPATLELVVVCGYYSMLAMVLNVANQTLPGGTQPPLKPLDQPIPVR